jgi:hypothetical protein
VLSAAVRRILCLLAAVPNLELLMRFPGVVQEPLPIDSSGQISLTVRQDCTILIQPDHDPIPRLAGGLLACAKINAIVILEVNGYGS